MKRNGVSSTNCNIGTQSPVKAGGGLIQTVLILGKLLNTFWVNVISSTSDIQGVQFLATFSRGLLQGLPFHKY